MRHIARYVISLGVDCLRDSGRSAPISPTAPSPSIPRRVTSSISATLTATNGGQPLAGIAVSVEGVAATSTGGSGQFAFTTSATTTQATLAFTGPTIVPRRLTLATRTRRRESRRDRDGGRLFDRFIPAGDPQQPGTAGCAPAAPPLAGRSEGFISARSLAPAARWTPVPWTRWRRPWSSGCGSGVAVGSVSRSSSAGLKTEPIRRDGSTSVWSEELGERVCGRARLGATPGRIELNPRKCRLSVRRVIRAGLAVCRRPRSWARHGLLGTPTAAKT